VDFEHQLGGSRPTSRSETAHTHQLSATTAAEHARPAPLPPRCRSPQAQQAARKRPSRTR
jgi:hypothetical protein